MDACHNLAHVLHELSPLCAQHEGLFQTLTAHHPLLPQGPPQPPPAPPQDWLTPLGIAALLGHAQCLAMVGLESCDEGCN